MKALILYPKVFPVNSGSRVHGYHLITGLAKHVDEIYLYNQPEFEQSNIHSIKAKAFFQFIKAILKADLIYLRLHNHPTKARILQLFGFLQKTTILEINGPVDELKLRGYTEEQVHNLEKKLAKRYQFASHVITVSPKMKEYCTKYLNIPGNKVTIVQNGGIQKNFKPQKVTPSVIWSGSSYPWQGFHYLKEMIRYSERKISFYLLSNEYFICFEEYPNVMQVQDTDNIQDYYDLVSYALVVYGDFTFSKVGFYNSSIKYYEALAQYKLIIATSHIAINDYLVNKNVKIINNPQQAVEYVLSNNHTPVKDKIRTWNDVARETYDVFNSLTY